MSHNHSLAEANLRLAADTMERTGWTVARLIAASVAPGAGQGARTSLPQAEKLGVDRAAKVMAKSNHTIKAYLAAWNAAADDGLCIPSSDLAPEDGATANLPDAEWSDYYTNTKPRGVGVSQVEKRVAEDPAYAKQILESITKTAAPEVKREAFVSLSSDDSVTEDVTTRSQARQNIERANDASDMNLRVRRSEERQEAEGKERGGARYVVADGLLVAAKKRLREAINEVHESSLSDEHRDLLRERIAEVGQLVQMFRAEIDGEASVDWDSELASLMGGE